MKNNIILLMFAFIILMATGCEQEKFIKSGSISCTQKDIILEYENAKLIDVRTEDEYNEYHLDKAINIPYEDIINVLSNDSEVNLDTPIIVYCRSGARSSKAYSYLKNSGYNHIYDLGAISKCN